MLAEPKSAKWLLKIMRWMDACDAKLPEPAFLKGDFPEWVQRLSRELISTLFPAAKLRVGGTWTAGEIGALLGHRVAYFHGFEHCIQPEFKRTFKKLDRKVVKQTRKETRSLLEGVRHRAQAVVCSRGTNSHMQNQRGFLQHSQEDLARCHRTFRLRTSIERPRE